MKKEKTYTLVRKLSWIVFAFAIAALSIAAVEYKRDVYVKSVETEVVMLESGANLVTQDDVLKELEDSFGAATMMNIGLIDVNLIEATIEQNPFMKNVDVFVDAHNVLHIQVNQREPIIRIIDKEGAHFYLDVDGYKIPVSPHYTPRVPIANGAIDHLEIERIDDDSPKTYKTVFAMAKKIYDDPFLKSLISQVYMDKEVGVLWIPTVGAKELIVGNEEELDDKVDRLKIFYKEGIPSVGWNKYKKLDLRFAGQVIGQKA